MAEMPQFIAAKPCTIPKGTMGVWQIPDLDISIPVYSTNSKNIQKVIDAENSASIDRWFQAQDIGDHYNSLSSNGKGKWQINKVCPNTVALFVKPAGTYRYTCQMTAIADVKSWGYQVNGQLLTPHSSTDILNSCCVGSDSSRNFVAVFKYDCKMP